MRRSNLKDVLIFAAVLLFASCYAHSQTTPGSPGQSNYPATISPASGAPSGNCPGTNSIYLNTANGNVYTCPTPGSSWVLAGGAGTGTVSANNGSAGALCVYAAAGGSTVCGPSGTSFEVAGTLTLGAVGVGSGGVTAIGSTSGSISWKCNANACTSWMTASPALFQAASGITLRHINQQVASDMAGKCSMSAATTCTFSIQSTYTNYLTFVSLDQASIGSIAANTCGASLSGTTVTITCLTSNSLTWDAWVIGNAS